MPEVNKERLVRMFTDMVKISSESLEEKDFAQYCINFLKDEIGCEVYEDNAKDAIGGNQSNIVAKYYGNSRKKALLFAAHLDTVKPGKDIVPVLDNGIIRSEGDTVLGADDKSGIASLFEALLYIKENDLDVPDIDIVLTVAEEIGLLGAKNLDYELLRAKEGYALDSEEIEGIFVRAPSQNTITINIEGLESHAGMYPEKGISAIKTASEAICNMPLGRIDSHTSANMGVIEGGHATNIIPKKCTVRGEVRSHSEEKLAYYTDKIKAAVFDACSRNRLQMPDGQVRTAICNIDIKKEYNAMHVKPGEHVLDRAVDVYRKLGISYKLQTGGGGSDANVFNEHDIRTIIIGTGMMDVHTVNEYIKTEDLERLSKIIIELLLHDV